MSSRWSIAASCHQPAAVVFIVINDSELDLIDLGDCLGERQLHRFEKGALPSVDYWPICPVGIPVQRDRLVDDLAQGGLDN